jgi:hypothetical protein
LHEVMAVNKNGTESTFKTGVAPKSGESGEDSAPKLSILKKLVNYKASLHY